jgi:hypothetical protein
MNESFAKFALPPRVKKSAIIAAAIGEIALIVGWITTPAAFYRAYLHSWLLWFDVSAGCMGITMVIHLLGGAWGSAVRRLAEAAAMVLPVMAVLFLPILIAVATGSLYPWANSATWQTDPLLVHRRPYLNGSFFAERAILYSVIWIGLAWMLWRGSRRQDQSTEAHSGAWLYPLSGFGLVVYVLTVGLFASTDWILSLQPDYKSTVFGLIIVTGQGVSGLCVVIAALAMMPANVLPRLVEQDEWKDLGSVLLTFAMLWCYLVVCQFVVNWMGDDQEQVGWYFRRTQYGWDALSWMLVILLLIMPLLLLLFRSIKRSSRALMCIAIVLLATRGLEGFWAVNAGGIDPAPLLSERFSWLDIVLPIGMGGAWILSFAWVLGRAPVMIDRRPAPEGATHAA